MVQEVKEAQIVNQEPEGSGKFIEKYEYDALTSLEKEMMETERMLIQISIRKKQILDRVVYLDAERNKQQVDLFKKYEIEQGSSIFIKENLEMVIKPPQTQQQ